MNKADVIERLEEMETYLRNKSYSDLRARDYCEWVGYALAMLREQEPIAPVCTEYDKAIVLFSCRDCKTQLLYGQRYCHMCGKAVKWDAGN